MLHICEFTSDLIKHNKLKLDPRRNRKVIPTFHDSCNPARAMGILEEPRYILRHACDQFYEMPENTIREQTFCCAGGAGPGQRREHGRCVCVAACLAATRLPTFATSTVVNMLACICAIDKATLPPLVEYWAPGVEVCGVHELLGNALVMDGESDARKAGKINLRAEELDDGDSEEGGDDA